MMIYEYPLNEGMRRLLRIEMLFQQAEDHMENDSIHSTLAAIKSLLDIVTLVSKNDLKIELIRILDRFMSLEEFSEEELQTMREVKASLNHLSIRAYDEIKESVFLNILKQRINIPGGVCGFDLPVLHHWLHKPHSVRKEHFYRWFSVLNVVQESVSFVLNQIRALSVKEVADFADGFHYRSIKWPALLMRMNVGDYDIYPEFSGNRHQLSIRLFQQDSPWGDAVQFKESVSFTLEICGKQ